MPIFSNLLLSNRITLIEETYADWLTTGDKVLDVGCGDGIVSVAIADKFKLAITGCDIDDYLSQKITYVHMRHIDKLPFPDHSFDTILFNDVLHHTSFKNQEKLLRESLRVVKKDIIIFELKPTLGAYIGDFILNKIYHPQMNVPFSYRNYADWILLFKKLPVNIKTRLIPRPSYSFFSHMAFRLTKK